MARGRTCLRRTAKSCGSDAPTLASSLAGSNPARRRWQTSPVAGKSTKETVKTIAQGRPGRSGEPVVTTLVYFVFYRTRGCGCIVRPAFPAPSDFRGPTFPAKLAQKHAARLRRCVLSSLRGAKRRSNPTFFCRAMDCFAEPVIGAHSRDPLARNDGPNCHRPRRRAIQYSRESSNGIERPRRTGYPAFAGYDTRAEATPALPRSSRDARWSAPPFPCPGG